MRNLVVKWNRYNMFKKCVSSWLARKTYTSYKNRLLTEKSLKKVNGYVSAPTRGEYFIEGANVLHINTLDVQGGAAKVAFRLQGLLKRCGYQSRSLVSQALSNDEYVETLDVIHSIKQRLLRQAEQDLGWLDFFHLASLRIKDLDIFKQADVVHLHNLHGYYFSPFALPELTALKPTVWTLHDMQAITGHCAHSFDCDRWLTGCGNCPDLNIYPAISKDTSAFLWETKKKIYANSYLTIVCPSKWLKDKVDRSILGNKDVRLIYNGIDNSVFRALDKRVARAELNLPQDKKILLFNAHGGTDNYWKGGSYVNEAFLYLRDRQDVLFLNAGVKQSSAKVHDESWADIPYTSDETILAKYYAAADLFIYPSLADNCPLVVLESMACGTPVVAFNTGGIPELVKHLNTGFLADYKNAGDFIKGIELFIDDSGRLSCAQQAATVAIEKDFTLQKMTEKYISLYQEAVRSRNFSG